MLRAAPWGIESPRLTNSPLAKRDLEEYLFNECFSYAAVISGAAPRNRCFAAIRALASVPPAPAATPKSVSCGLLQWADVICVMEQKHKDRLMAEYRRIIENKPLHVLDIPDDYRYMDPELVRQLEELVPDMLGI